MKTKSIKPEWEKDSWCVSIIAEALTFGRIKPIGKDASHITRKLRNKIETLLAQARQEGQNEFIRRMGYRGKIGGIIRWLSVEEARSQAIKEVVGEMKKWMKTWAWKQVRKEDLKAKLKEIK